MTIHEMNARECREMLGRVNVARLACARNNQPYIVPIHVDLDGEFLYGYATLGQKIEWMRDNPLVCVEMDELVTHGQWASVVAFGRYEELPHQPEFEGSRQVAASLFEKHPAWWEPASVPLAAHEPRTPVVFRIRLSRVTGRRAAMEPEKRDPVETAPVETKRPGWLTQMLRGTDKTRARSE